MSDKVIRSLAEKDGARRLGQGKADDGERGKIGTPEESLFT